MNTWNELDGSTFFNKIFTHAIHIGKVKLSSINIDNIRPIIILEFDISDFPSEPPAKWKQSGFNTCRIGLNCSDVTELKVNNVPTQKSLLVKVSKQGSVFKITLSNDESLIQFTTKHPILCGPSGYVNMSK
ncbi:hypothetical protein KDX30_15530 [Pseudomonas sp. CDFA 553]|uniref:Imm50 family immunity protein n=1 Tax=Pseudomonas quasicaspiana TaxID=2829821 RepID=UPI001E63F0C2|nr:Imm50 family immunity protein [Pseudomonas quasicaspiana]MCD5989313.1 hypothetical protein [Pseudomonas quasicaspiana]